MYVNRYIKTFVGEYMTLIECIKRLLKYGTPAQCGDCIGLCYDCPHLECMENCSVGNNTECKSCKSISGIPVCYVIDNLVQSKNLPLCDEYILTKRLLEII